jgi:hypothetical protein
MSPSPHVFEDAIETLQQLKSTFSPTEKLLVIRQTVEKMTPVAQELLGENYVWNMDDLFPIFLFVVVRARIPDLGSELDFVDNFMDPSLESGELGIMYTTLKVSRGVGFLDTLLLIEFLGQLPTNPTRESFQLLVQLVQILFLIKQKRFVIIQ